MKFSGLLNNLQEGDLQEKEVVLFEKLNKSQVNHTGG